MLTKQNEIKETAQNLVDSNAEAVPEIEEIWFFYNDEEIRLIEVHSSLPPDNEIAAYHFPADPDNGIGYPIAVALINSADKELPLPDGWGSWDKAERLFVRKADGKS